MVDAANIEKDDVVIEVGPGIGTVTKELAKKSKQIFAFEIDKEKLPILTETLNDFPNVKVIEKNILDVNIDEFVKENGIERFKFVSSLPYNIAKRILKNILESENKPEIISVLIQKEVAEKYVPNKDNRTFLSNYLELFADGEIVQNIGPEAFFPAPEVDSSILQIIPKGCVNVDNGLIKFIKNGFLNPRKKLSNVLASIYRDIDWKNVFNEKEFDENVRAEDLKLDDWIKLYEVLMR